jgi:hypothetical protein
MSPVARPVREHCSCGRSYVPEPFNAHRQQGCLHPECRRERKRRRDRLRYHHKYHDDEAFRTAEKQRRVECRRQAKAQARGATGPAVGDRPAARMPADAAAAVPGGSGPGLEPRIEELHWTQAGMMALLTGEQSGESVEELLAHCTERGRRLALARGQSP